MQTLSYQREHTLPPLVYYRGRESKNGYNDEDSISQLISAPQFEH